MKKFFLLFLVSFLLCFIGSVDAKEIKVGTYKIVSAIDNSKLLSEENGNIVLGDENSEGITIWDVYSNGANYFIKSHNDNNYSVDLDGARLNNGSNIHLYKTNTSNAQKWNLNYANDSYYYISSCLGDYNLDVYGGNNNVGTNIWLYKNNRSNAQKWKFVKLNESEKVLEDGTYIIKSRINNLNVIDLYNADTNNRTNIQMYTNNYSWAQVWNIKYSNGYYTFTSYLDDSKSIDIYNGSYKNRTNIWLYNANLSNAQKFMITHNENSTYSIRSYDGLWTLDVAGGSTKSGTNLWLYSPNGSDAQDFIFEKVSIDPIETGYYSIDSVLANDKSVGINNPVVFNGKNVELRTNEDHNNTKWYIKKLSGDRYSISVSENTKYFLGLKGGNTASGTNVELNTSNANYAQGWCIRKNDDGTYSIINVKSQKVLDIYNGSSNNGTNVWIYNSNKSNAQKFRFTKTEPSNYMMAYDVGRYIIKSAVNESMVLDVYGANKANGTNVQTYSLNNSNAQNWKLEYIGDGAYVIKSLINPNLVLTGSGNNVIVSKYIKKDYQQWYFEKNGNVATIINMANGKYLNIDSSEPVNRTNISLSSSKSATTNYVLTRSSSVIKYKGVDLSVYNTITSWTNLADEVDFAVIRAGFGEEFILSDGTDKYQDKKYIEYVKKCEENNIPYALYFYSYANKVKFSDRPSYNLTNIDSADSEASHMIKLIKKITTLGYSPTLNTQVFYDQEETSHIYNKVRNYYGETNSNNPKTRKLLTDIINDFCSRMNSNGYKCGLYANSTWLYDKINVQDVAKNNSIWVAQWPGYTTFSQGISNKTSYAKTDYKIWQFTSSGTVSGISGRVDLDIGYDIFE